MQEDRYTYKTYGESSIEIPYGWYTISEIKTILINAVKREKALKKLLRQSMKEVKNDNNTPR